MCIRPRRSLEKEKTKRTIGNYLAVWVVTLIIVIIIMYIRRKLVE
jgi:hypothetical protein